MHILIQSKFMISLKNNMKQEMDDQTYIVLTTKRCRLRYFEEKDLLPFIEYRNNDLWMKYQEFKNLKIEAYRKVLLTPFDILRGSQLAISEILTDNLIGDIYVKKIDDFIYIGFTINPKCARKGYTSEVINAYIQKLIKEYPKCEIRAETDLDNLASNRFLKKQGFILIESNKTSNIYKYQK